MSSMSKNASDKLDESFGFNSSPNVAYNQKCEKHDKLIHSYVAKTNQLLCTACIYEEELDMNQIKQIP